MRGAEAGRAWRQGKCPRKDRLEDDAKRSEHQAKESALKRLEWKAPQLWQKQMFQKKITGNKGQLGTRSWMGNQGAAATTEGGDDGAGAGGAQGPKGERNRGQGRNGEHSMGRRGAGEHSCPAAPSQTSGLLKHQRAGMQLGNKQAVQRQLVTWPPPAPGPEVPKRLPAQRSQGGGNGFGHHEAGDT